MKLSDIILTDSIRSMKNPCATPTLHIVPKDYSCICINTGIFVDKLKPLCLDNNKPKLKVEDGNIYVTDYKGNNSIKLSFGIKDLERIWNQPITNE